MWTPTAIQRDSPITPPARPPALSPQLVSLTMAATEPLSLLLKAEKKSTVKSIFEHAFRFRDTDGVGGSGETLLGELGIKGKEVGTLGTGVLRSVSELVRDAVYSANTKADVVALCPRGLDERLKALVADVVVSWVLGGLDVGSKQCCRSSTHTHNLLSRIGTSRSGASSRSSRGQIYRALGSSTLTGALISRRPLKRSRT